MILVWLLVLAFILSSATWWERCRPQPHEPAPPTPRRPVEIAGVRCDDRDARPFRVPPFPTGPVAASDDARRRFQAAVEQRFIADIEAAARHAFIRNPFDMPYVIGATS